jgi:aminoglycoside phosphotransferase (APT) family kinase protein
MGAFGIPEGTAVERAAGQGTFHRLYDVREPGHAARLLRVATLPGERAANLMALEADVMAALRREDFPVPACVFRAVPQGGVPRGVHLVERAEGVSLTTLDADEARMQVALADVARFLKRLHAQWGERFGPLRIEALRIKRRATRPIFAAVHDRWMDYLRVRLDEHLGACAAAGDITRAEAARIDALFDRRGLRVDRPALLHGDPGSHNFLVDGSGIRGVIDWEDALSGDPIFDLASLCTFHPERRHAGIWAAYGVQIAPGNPEWKRFWLYFLRIALAKTVHRRRFAYADTPGRPPAARRIQQALERLGEGRGA